MYTMTIDGRPLFHPAIPGYGLESPKLTLEANKFGTLTFTIYPDHPEYANFVLKQSRIKVYNDGTLMFEARPALGKRMFKGGVMYTCEDALSRLNDVVWRPESYHGSAQGILSWLLEKYNGIVDSGNTAPYLHINGGTIDVDGYGGGFDPKDKAYTVLWDLITENTIDEFGGYLIPEYTENSGITLNYLDDDALPVQGQAIALGQNLQDLAIDIDTEEFFTVLIPLGADEKNTNPEMSSNKKLPITIKDVNDDKIYLQSSSLSTYGWVEKTMTWDDIKSASSLKTKGQNYLNKYGGKFAETMTISAVDLHDAGVNVEALRWMSRAPVVSSVHGIDGNYTIRRMEIMLGAPMSTVIEIGNERQTATDRMRRDARRSQKQYNSLDDRVWDLEDTT